MDNELGTPRIQLLAQSLMKEIANDCKEQTKSPMVKVFFDIKISVPSDYAKQLGEYFPKIEKMLAAASEDKPEATIERSP